MGSPPDEVYPLLYVRLPASIAYISFAATLSSSLNSRMGILAANWGNYIREASKKRKQLFDNVDGSERQRLEKELDFLDSRIITTMKRLRKFKVAFSAFLTAIGLFAITVLLSVLSSVYNGGIIFAAIPCLWLGMLGTMFALVILLHDIWHHYSYVEDEHKIVKDFRYFVAREGPHKENELQLLVH